MPSCDGSNCGFGECLLSGRLGGNFRMKYKISNAYLSVNEEDIAVGVVLGEEDKPQSPFRTEYIRASEYEKD